MLYRRPLKWYAHFVTASLHKNWSDVPHSALLEFKLAAEKCENTEQRARIEFELGETCIELARRTETPSEDVQNPMSRQYCQEALEHYDVTTDMITDKASSVRLSALLRKVFVLDKLNRNSRDGDTDNRILDIFHEIRALSPTVLVNGENFALRELLYCSGNDTRVMDCFSGLAPLQRLSLVIYADTDDFRILGPRDFNVLLLPAAIRTDRVSQLLELYHEMLDNFTLGKCEILWYDALVSAHIAIRSPLQLALDVLRQVSTYIFTSSEIEIGVCHETATDSVGCFILSASDVLYRQFRCSATSDEKAILLQEAEALPLQPLAQSAQMSPSDTTSYLIVLARMYKRIGTMQKYQEILQQAFDLCWAGLHDRTTANDLPSMRNLAKILAIGPTSLLREAEIVASAQVYYLGKLSDLHEFQKDEEIQDVPAIDATEGTVGYSTYESLSHAGALHIYQTFSQCTRLQIEHKCAGDERWGSWEGSTFMCLCCTSSILCQSCYDERIRRNKSDKVEGLVDFCCDSGEYLKAPLEGWKGIRDGVIYIENEKPIEVEIFLERVRDKWRQAWADFWKG